jgi:hypothetical protein
MKSYAARENGRCVCAASCSPVDRPLNLSQRRKRLVSWQKIVHKTKVVLTGLDLAHGAQVYIKIRHETKAIVID